MALTPGTRLGPYEVIAQIGEGGMGQVWRARDTKLNRDVALKILPDSFANDPDRLARFTREAQTLASLNHPNIAHIHGLEESGGVQALVMELVEGEDLSQRIARGPIPLDEALPIAKQIADALEAAHEQGVIHRDLKPANIKVRDDGTVKVLDFGLAKLAESPVGTATGPPPLSLSPTITSPAMMTGVGVLLGTAAYMSPEQAKGKAADKRSDIWAFGCVLFEMLTGRRAFAGEDVSDTLATVLKSDPDWRALPLDLPSSIRTLVQRCLVKDRHQRIADISVAQFLLSEPAPPATMLPSGPSVPVTPARETTRRVGVLVTASLCLTVIAITAAVWSTSRGAPSSPRPVTRFAVALPSNWTLPPSGQPSIAISPDGTRLVFVGRVGSGVSQIYSRASDQLEVIPIRGTEGGTHPFFSPDGQWIGFNSADGKLKKVPAGGGAPVMLCDAPALRGATWLPDDSIIFFKSQGGLGLWRVSAAGGTPVEVSKPDGKTEFSHRWPEVLPDGNAVLFTIQRTTEFASAAIGVLRLDTGERRVLVEGGSFPHYLPSGHLVFSRGAAVFAVPFDRRTLQVTGAPILVLEGVLNSASQGVAQLAASGTGLMAYLPTGGTAQGGRTLVWVDRHGVTQPVPAPRQNYEFPRLSPDGQRVAVTIEGANNARDIWLYQFSRGTLSRVTAEKDGAETAVWTPDGKRLTYASVSRTNPARQIIWKPVDGTTGDEVLSGSDRHLHLGGWSPQGDALVAMGNETGGIWILQTSERSSQPAEKRAPHAFLQTPFQIQAATISPDGRWLAYAANDTNRFEIYVQAFSGGGGKSQISTDGGVQPVWAKDGRELFYRNGDRMMAVSVAPKGGGVEAGTPRLLFEGRFAVSGLPGDDAWYDVSPDGQRFLMIRAEEATTTIVMVQEWLTELKRLVPTD